MLSGALPYRDFYVEYPPGALPVFAAPAVGDEPGYARRFKALSIVFGWATVVLVVAALAASGASRGHVLAAAGLVASVPLALGPAAIVNYDLWPATLAAGGVAGLAASRSALGGALLGASAAAKVYAVFLLPVALVHLIAAAGRVGARRCLVGFSAVLAAAVLPFALVAPGAIANDLWIAVRRPLQIESLGSSLLLTAHRFGLYQPSVNSDFNSQNLDGTLPAVVAGAGTIVALAALVGIALALFRRADRDDAAQLFAAAAGTLAAAVAFGKVLSPQYLVWLVPLVALVPSVAAYALVLAALVLTQLWFPSRYGELVALGEVSWLVLARNLVLVALAVVLTRRLAFGRSHR
jgi:uncharacterized membrane protein